MNNKKYIFKSQGINNFVNNLHYPRCYFKGSRANEQENQCLSKQNQATIINHHFYFQFFQTNMDDVINFQQYMKNQQNTVYSFKCGFASFVATYIAGVMHPFDLIKTRFQSHDGKSQIYNEVPKYSGVFQGLKQIYQAEGFKGLYKGFYISLLSQALATAFFFLLYERRKQHYEDEGFQVLKAVALSSIQASVIATIVTQPIWVIKTRMLLNTEANIGEFENFIKKSKQIYKQGGLYGFSKGLGISLVLSFSGVFQMYVYQGSKLIYEKFKIPESALYEKTFICGAVSKMTSVLITYPLTTIRTRIQQNQYFMNRQTAKYKSAADIVLKIKQQEGVAGFFKGIVPNLMRGIPQRGIYFYSYQIIKHMIGINRTKREQF